MAKKIKTAASSNLYTALLALATGVVLSTAIFVALKCYWHYGSVFKVMK